MKYDLKKHDFSNPDPWVALALDQSTFFDEKAKDALMRNNASKSRQFVLPLIRPIARLSIVLTQIIRIVIPNSLAFPKTLHKIIVWGMRYFVSPDANYLIYRHFHIGSQMLKFLGDNIVDGDIKSTSLFPETIDDFGNNTYIQHDLNIFNFVIQVSAKLKEQGRNIEQLPLEKLNFSAIQEFDQKIREVPKKWHNFLDLQSSIELYTPLFGLLLTDKDFWRSSNSLQLDETIAIYVARLFNRESILGLVSNKHPSVPFSTLEAGFRLMLHGLDAENLYGFIRYMKEQQKNLKRKK